MLKHGGLALGSLGTFSLPALSQAIQASSSPFKRPRLKITDVRTAQVSVHGPQTHVRIYTDAGLIGQGESTDAAVGSAALIRSFRRGLVGQDPLNVEALWERIRTSGVFAGAQGGQYTTALTGVEIALWDLAGKALGLPVYQLLGGKFRDKVRIYCDSGRDDVLTPESEKKIDWIKSQGFTAMKVDLDDAADPNRFDRVNWTANNAEIDRMVKWVEHVKGIIPASMDFACDMHGRYDAPTGKKVAKVLEPFRLLWLEEPVPPEDIDALVDIRHSTTTPICVGENIYMRWGYKEIFEKRAADIIMPDIQKTGGLAEAKKIADMSHAYEIPFAPHCVVSPIGQMASAHVCASIPNFLVCEWHWIDNLDTWKSFVQEGEIIQKGYITVTDKPGLGVEMNEEAAKKVQIPNTPWFEPGM
ncbi:mandelate racemase/muconate lactonizing enzyme family protein [Terriglobus albidus]|uniref:mandelate racemase/muconate lactonizing enzyme family protein n=1 Tax=Terriglobus albidus TaxID=1592106 RepID=UPI0021E0393F|nr:mandelate racemase/muconate lactonizing enzyme family protein [Terriglobus albidus]